MTSAAPRLYLLSPILGDPAIFRPALAEACATGLVMAVLLRLAPADERSLVNTTKALAPAAQDHGVAVILADPDPGVDLASVVTRSGADGAHAAGAARLRDLRQRLAGERTIGAGSLRSKHDAMEAGELDIDYLLFGEPRPDGFVPSLELVEERTAWWADIFQVPCVAFAPDLAAVLRLAATGCDFVALGDAVWHHPAGIAAALAEAAGALADHAAEAPA